MSYRISQLCLTHQKRMMGNSIPRFTTTRHNKGSNSIPPLPPHPSPTTTRLMTIAASAYESGKNTSSSHISANSCVIIGCMYIGSRQHLLLYWLHCLQGCVWHAAVVLDRTNIWWHAQRLLLPASRRLKSCRSRLTLNLLTTTIVAPRSNASKWQMGFNSAFKGLIAIVTEG